MGRRGTSQGTRCGHVLSGMDEAPSQSPDLGNPLGVGRMDHGATMEITPIDFVLLAMFVALVMMWLDK